MFALLFMFLFGGCKKGELLPNAAPETYISLDTINLSGQNRLNSTVSLSWYGTDIDGYIAKYEIKINDSDWFSTQIQDSVFLFAIDPDEDSTDITFQVRSIDDEGLADPTPDVLIVPLKNSPPVVTFETETLPVDTTNLVITFRYLTSDPDGNATLRKTFLKANNGSWHEIDINQKLISVVAKDAMQTGSGVGEVYYGTNKSASGVEIDDFINGGDNILQLKVTDIANSESEIDSTSIIYVKEQTSDLIILGGHNATITPQYHKLIGDAYSSFDYLNFAGNNGLNQPRFWNPTFDLLISHYDKLVFHTDESTFSNPLTGADGRLLDFAAPGIQTAVDNSKKVLITTAFATGVDLSIMSDVLGIDSFTSSKGQAFFQNDSLAISEFSGYPDIQPANFLLAVDPFYHSIDSEVFYTAGLTPNGGWTGPRTVGSLKRNQANNINLVVFSIELHRLTKLKSNQEQLVSKILNEAFNW